MSLLANLEFAKKLPVVEKQGLDSHLNCNTGMLRSCNGNDL